MFNLLTLLNAADKSAIQETNNAALDTSLAFQRSPSLVAGVPTALTGPPTAGTFPQYQCWVDALSAIWLCTVAGTPGTWTQIAPGIAAAFPGAAPAAGYELLRSDQGAKYIYTGNVWIPGITVFDPTVNARRILTVINDGGQRALQLSDQTF